MVRSVHSLSTKIQTRVCHFTNPRIQINLLISNLHKLYLQTRFLPIVLLALVFNITNVIGFTYA